jgi:cytidylate kinase
MDIELDRRLKELIDSRDGLVLDTWAMAYIYQGPLIRIWLESDEASRARKCFVSQGEDAALDLRGCHELLSKKDEETRLKFLRRLKFDLFSDMSRYDVIISNTELIPVPTRQASDEGIKKFAPVVHDVTTYMIERAVSDPADFTKTREEVRASHGTMVQKIQEYPWSFRRNK